MWEYKYCDELCHHGVKGMKWGVRKSKIQKRREKRDAIWKRDHNEDGSMSKRGQKENYKSLKKRGFVSPQYVDKYLTADYEKAYATKQASADSSILLVDGRRDRLSEKQRNAGCKNLDKMEKDFERSHVYLTEQNRRMVDDLLGKHKNKKINGETAEQRLLDEAELYTKDRLYSYGEMTLYYLQYFE